MRFRVLFTAISLCGMTLSFAQDEATHKECVDKAKVDYDQRLQKCEAEPTDEGKTACRARAREKYQADLAACP
jgi:hypothetical protein